MPKPKRKEIVMLVRVSVPADMTAAQGRREVRTRIADVTGHYSHIDTKDIKVIGCLPVPNWNKL